MVRRDLSTKEKLLLQLMGNQPNLTNKELCEIIGFKYAEYVSTLQKKLQKREYFDGPLMFADWGKIFRNRVSRIYAFIMFDISYDSIRALLQEVGCWFYFYPLEEGAFRKYLVVFLNTDTEELKRVFDYLKNSGIISYYHLFEQEGKLGVVNPTFLTNGKDTPIHPDFDHLTEDVDIPDLRYGAFADISLNKVAQLLIIHLWMGRGGCDLRKIVRKENEYRKDQRTALKKMLRAEKQEEMRGKLRTELKEWKGDLPLREFREAYQLLVSHAVLEKVYYVNPFPRSMCRAFILLLKCKSIEATNRIIFNFGKNVRIFTRSYMLQSVETGTWYGAIYAAGDPFLEGKLMNSLDRCPEIEDRKLFPVRSYPASHWAAQGIPIEGYYDPETQTLGYPYDLFYERVKQKVEEDFNQRREARALV